MTKKTPKALEAEQRILASLATEEERQKMRPLLDQMWELNVQLARMKIQRDKAMLEYHDATRALFSERRNRRS